jgi:hypothetical protein
MLRPAHTAILTPLQWQALLEQDMAVLLHGRRYIVLERGRRAERVFQPVRMRADGPSLRVAGPSDQPRELR